MVVNWNRILGKYLTLECVLRTESGGLTDAHNVVSEEERIIKVTPGLFG